jgi:uncharacterized integral membrane protein
MSSRDEQMSEADADRPVETTDATTDAGDATGSGDGAGDPLRGSRTSRGWVAVATLAVIFVLLIVFVAQNTDRVAVRFFGWTWHAPLAVAILVGAVAGMVLAVVAGTLRIWQLHRRVRRAAKA